MALVYLCPQDSPLAAQMPGWSELLSGVADGSCYTCILFANLYQQCIQSSLTRGVLAELDSLINMSSSSNGTKVSGSGGEKRAAETHSGTTAKRSKSQDSASATVIDFHLPAADGSNGFTAGLLGQNTVSEVSFTSSARDSVGPLFPTAPVMDNNFLMATTTGKMYPIQMHGVTGENNHCYRNAVLTALLSPSIVSRYLLVWYCRPENGDLSKDPSSVITAVSKIAIYLFFQQTFSQPRGDSWVKNFWDHFCYPKDPNGRCTRRFPTWTWRSYRGDTTGVEENLPQDAHEFLTWILAAMPRQFLPGMSGWQSDAPLERFEWIFKSRTVTRTVCSNCRYPVRRRGGMQSESCLILGIPDTGYASPTSTGPQPVLDDLVDESFRTTLSATCSRCNKFSDCVQERKLQHAPGLLTMVVSRGKYDSETGEMGKDCAAIIIPERIDLSTHLNAHEFGSGSKVTYSLCSVVSHSGNQLDGGHYVSFIRQDADKGKWLKVDDEHIQKVSISDFDDSAVADLDEDQYLNRLTPYILFYERDFQSQVLVPGRAALNVNEGENKDEPPSQWTGKERATAPEGRDSKNERNTQGDKDEDVEEDVEDIPLTWTMGAKGEEQNLPAVLLVKVAIGDVEIELPRHVISHLNWKIRKDVTIDIRLRAPKSAAVGRLASGKNYVETSLSDIQNEACCRKRLQQEKKKTEVPQLAWNQVWTSVIRNADDLTEDEIEEMRRVCSEQSNRDGVDTTS